RDAPHGFGFYRGLAICQTFGVARGHERKASRRQQTKPTASHEQFYHLYFTRTFAGREITGADHRRVKMTSILLEINLFADEQRCTALLRRFTALQSSGAGKVPGTTVPGLPIGSQSRVNARSRAPASVPPIGRSLHFVCIRVKTH